MTIRDILVPTDFSDCADSALAHATRLADRSDARLHLLHVVNELDASWYNRSEGEEGAADLRTQVETEAQKRLHALTPDPRGFDVRTKVVQQMNVGIADAIREYVEEEDIDLVVMGTHGRRALQRLMLGSVSQTLVRRSPCPVMTVRDRSEEAGPDEVEDYQHVLAPIDFSEPSHAALRLAKEVVARFQAQLQLLFIAEKRMVPTFSDTGVPGLSVVEMDPDIVENAEAALRELAESVGGPDVSSSYHVEKGDVAQGIVDFAETNDTDLIVMATRGVSGITRFMLGSNTERVIRVAPCPVLTAPTRTESGDED